MGGWVGSLGVRFGGSGSHGGCEQRSEVIVKIQEKIGGRGVRGDPVRSGQSGRPEQRIEVFVKIKKKNQGVEVGSGSGWGAKVDVNEEVKLL